ncbi:MAG: DUF4421 domain-containing protein [Bacteroidota bacterium]|nr:DUF4421 domain-containing protein [Bacteroidota bacterium]
MCSDRIYTVVMFVFATFSAFAQKEDTTFIAAYAKPNSIELSNAYNSTKLHFNTRRSRGNTANFFSNNGLFSGVYLNYNWLILGYGITVPFTSRDKNVKDFKSYRLRLRSYYYGWGVEGSIDSYKGLLSQSFRNRYIPVDGVRYITLGANVFHVFNYKKYSYNAAQYLSQQQLKSSGSFLLHIHPAYYALGLQTSTSPVSDSVQKFLRGNPRWLTVTGSAGYGYNKVWDEGKWIVSPIVEAGLGGLYKFGYRRKLKPAALFNASLVAGYSGSKNYIYIIAETYHNANFVGTSVFTDNRFRVTITAGYRLYGLRKKVLGLL